MTNLENFSMREHVHAHVADFHLDESHASMPVEELADLDHRVLPIVREAIRLGILPSFSLDANLEIDMTGMLPTVAEAYTLTLLIDIVKNPSLFRQEIALKVPAFNPRVVMLPSSVERWSNHRMPSAEGMCA